MPTYEYECVECGAVVEIFQPITEPARRRLRKTDPKPCDCGARVRRRIGTGAGVIFKGTGFYETDYRSDAYKKAAKAEKDGPDKKPEKSDKESSAQTGETQAKSKTGAKPSKKKGPPS